MPLPRGGWAELSTPAPSVYRTRSYLLRRRALFGLAGVALLLIGYALGRWQDTPAAPAAAAPQTSAPAPIVSSSSAPESPAPETPAPVVLPILQAEDASELSGIESEDTGDEGGGKNIGYIAAGDFLRFDDVDFGETPITQLEVRVASEAGDGGQMEVRLDAPDAPPVGALSVTRTGGWQNWRTDVVTVTPVTGKHAVFLTFARPDGDEFININWLRFRS